MSESAEKEISQPENLSLEGRITPSVEMARWAWIEHRNVIGQPPFASELPFIQSLIEAALRANQQASTPSVERAKERLYDYLRCAGEPPDPDFAADTDALILAVRADEQGRQEDEQEKKDDHGAELIGQIASPLAAETKARLFAAFEAGWDAFERTRAHRKSADSYDAAFKSAWSAYEENNG